MFSSQGEIEWFCQNISTRQISEKYHKSLVKSPRPNKRPLFSAWKMPNLGSKHLKPTSFKSFKAPFYSHHHGFVHILWQIYSKYMLNVISIHQKMPHPFFMLNFILKIPQRQRLFWFHFRVTFSIFYIFMENRFQIYSSTSFYLSKNAPTPFSGLI